MKRFFILTAVIASFLFQDIAFAQQTPIGEWRDHLPWSYTIAVAEAGDIIYCATANGIIIFSKSENSISRLTKINGLSDVGISDIKYSKELQALVVGYSNTNIDIIKSGTVINIPDIKRKQILGNKILNSITLKDDYAYLSCGFGIVVLDVVKEEIHDTYYIGPGGTQLDILELTYNDTAFFAATETGIYHAPVNSPNLANFAIWHRFMDFLPSAGFNLITEYNGNIIANRNNTSSSNKDTLYYYNGSSWQRLSTIDYSGINSLRVCCGELVISYDYYVSILNAQYSETLKIWNFYGTTPQPNDAIADNSGNYWIADRANGLVKSWSQGFNSFFIKPAGPTTTSIYDISASGSSLWMVPGGINGSWGNTYQTAKVYSFIEENWNVFDPWNTPALDSLRDMVVVAVNPGNPSQVFAGSWTRGILEFLNGQFKANYGKDNSSLEANVIEGGQNVKVGGLDFDDNGNLWASNSGAERIVSKRKPDGTWQSYDLGSIASGKDVGTLIADSYNQKWILARHYQNNENYLYVFNEQNQPGNQVKGMKAGEGNGNIPGSNVFSIAEDKDGEVWIGTDEGVAVFYDPSRIFSGSNFDAERILVNFDGYVQYLLESEVVTAIEVDGANRKWIGTDRAGVFLLSEDGTEQIYHFTEDNSPLFSNQITDISIDPNTGEVFIGTSRGLIAFKGTATEGVESYDDIYAYPNPVPPGYSGAIGIKGLITNSIVKITDISGNLIYETRSEGGQAVWYGTDFNGRRAASGVYLIFVSDETGEERMVSKIVFLN
ncbi:MAG: hypothetical protein KKA81_06010 [Bacteroidetes bacterium]|nr:hypothetical protein [Bacteroidota bacterium]